MGLFLANFDVLLCLVLINGFVLKMSYLVIILLVLLISYESCFICFGKGLKGWVWSKYVVLTYHFASFANLLYES